MCACTHKGERAKTRNVIFFVFSPNNPQCKNATIVDKNTKLNTWRVFAWRPFAPPCENTTDGRRKLATYECVVSSPGGAKGIYFGGLERMSSV